VAVAVQLYENLSASLLQQLQAAPADESHLVLQSGPAAAAAAAVVGVRVFLLLLVLLLWQIKCWSRRRL
jgi:hypothetical protein